MKKYKVTGMSCAACQARVEKAVSKVDGVTSCSVSLLTNTMGVEGDAGDKAVIKAVKDAGYGASVLTDEDTLSLGRDELRKMKVRLISSVIVLLVLMYFSMGHMISLPVPMIFHNKLYLGILEAVLTLVICIINRKFFVSGIRAVFNLSPNMDTLIATGSGAAFIYSMAVLITGEGDYYFESAAMILTLVTVGKTLEQYSKGKTTSALESLTKLAPDTCTIEEDGQEKTISTKDLKAGDTVIVRPGESYPCDGEITEGETSSDESIVTGESMPVDKKTGDMVISAAINLTGYVKVRATRVGHDTTLSQIITMVSEASATKAPVARLADKISGVFVPAVMGVAAVTFAMWMILGKDVGYSLARAISVLVVSCPCALGLATPVAIMVGSGVGAKHGILYKTAGALQEAGNVKIAAIDKTGTVTTGVMKVAEVGPEDGVGREDLIRLAAAAERGSEHPIGKAIAALAEPSEEYVIQSFKALSGSGVEAVVSGHKVHCGNIGLIREVTGLEIPEREQDQGVIYVACDGSFIGSITVADTIREDSSRAVEELRNMGIYTVLLTGDGEQAAREIADRAGVDKVIWKVTPAGKSDVIRQLRAYGKCAMTGDGINDAPALTEADTGVAIGAGTDVAIDSADIVLMNSSLSDLAAAIRLSRRTYRVILQNLFWALFYNVLLIPVAIGAYTGLGITMTPGLGALAMSLSSLFVVTNALRLNLTDIYKAGSGHKRSAISDITVNVTATEKEDTKMTKTMKINGMMCGHCEARVKKVLEAIDGVASAQVSHEKGEALVTLDGDVSDEVLTKAVTDQDYEVVSIG
ncbi:Cu2+-exporting ATPase [Ruminococcaceae bacterium YRB3002]|nr:Cu2+-exporting ATPase [Ruminococcaceae bacterium YRB3002]